MNENDNDIDVTVPIRDYFFSMINDQEIDELSDDFGFQAIQDVDEICQTYGIDPEDRPDKITEGFRLAMEESMRQDIDNFESIVRQIYNIGGIG